jgi:hypothetical protein
VEKDIGFETLLVPIAEGFFDQALDGVVQAFHRAISQPMLKESGSSGMFWEFFIGRDKGLIPRSGKRYRF